VGDYRKLPVVTRYSKSALEQLYKMSDQSLSCFFQRSLSATDGFCRINSVTNSVLFTCSKRVKISVFFATDNAID